MHFSISIFTQIKIVNLVKHLDFFRSTLELCQAERSTSANLTQIDYKIKSSKINLGPSNSSKSKP